MRIVKKLFKWLFICVMALIFLLAVGLVLMRAKPFEKVPFIGGYKPLVVLGGSMEPAIKVGSAVVVSRVAPEDIKTGDVITFKTSSRLETAKTNQESLITHRVVDIERKNGQLLLTTKGDANKTNDTGQVPGNDVFGRAVLSLPYLGYFGSYVKTPIGFLLFLVVPGLSIILIEFRNIFVELKSNQVVGDVE